MGKENKSTIIVDSNEPDSMYNLILQEGLPVRREHLNVGDYQIGYVIVERKTVPDLISSVKDGRLWRQLYNMKQSEKEYSTSGLLAVIGEIPTWDFVENRTITGEKYKYYSSLIDSISVRCITSFKVNFRWFKTAEQFVSYLGKIYASVKVSGTSSRPITIKKEFRTLEQVKSDILSCIPTIGRDTADILSKEYSILELSNMKVEELAKIKLKSKKVGYSKAKSIIEYLTK